MQLPQLFPEWSNSVYRLALVLAVLGIVGIPLLCMGVARSPYMTGERLAPEQPVKFDHRHHVRDDGIPCLYCHYESQRSPVGGVPPTGLCMNCHNQIWTTSPELAPVRASVFGGAPIAWQRVNEVPDYVFFNHSIHLAKGVGCVTCHGRVDLMGQVYQATPLTMGFCLDCHRAPERWLRPPSLVTDMEWEPPAGDALAIGRRVREALQVNPPTDCTACHR